MTEAWLDLQGALLGAIEYDDLGTPHLAGSKAEIPAALTRLREIERLAWAEVAAARAMLDQREPC